MRHLMSYVSAGPAYHWVRRDITLPVRIIEICTIDNILADQSDSSATVSNWEIIFHISVLP